MATVSDSTPSTTTFLSLHDHLKAAFKEVKPIVEDSYLVEGFLTPMQANELLMDIDQNVTFLQRDDPRMQFRIYGKTMQLPRDKAVYGEVKINEEEKEREEPFYKYAKDTPAVECWKDSMLESIASQIKNSTGQSCNHVVVNQYRSGNDYIGDHRDKSETFEVDSSVLTLSLGSERVLRLKKFKGKKVGESKSIVLPSGSLFVLGPKTNAQWKHSIPKSKKVLGRRISLTYRAIAARRTSKLE